MIQNGGLLVSYIYLNIPFTRGQFQGDFEGNTVLLPLKDNYSRQRIAMRINKRCNSHSNTSACIAGVGMGRYRD